MHPLSRSPHYARQPRISRSAVGVILGLAALFALLMAPASSGAHPRRAPLAGAAPRAGLTGEPAAVRRSNDPLTFAAAPQLTSTTSPPPVTGNTGPLPPPVKRGGNRRVQGTHPVAGLTGEPAAVRRSNDPLTFAAAPQLASSPSTPVAPAHIGPPPPPVKRGVPIPCPLEWCQKIIDHFCHRFDCSLLAKEFRGTASNNSEKYRKELRDAGDAAFKPPWNGNGFAVHHIVPQGEAGGGTANFAQAALRRAGIEADDIHNLAALRGPDLQQGTAGYQRLLKTSAGRALAMRMAHSDTYSKYYYQQVNQRFAQWIRDHGGRYPNKQQVYAILDGIKRDLYNGGKGFIKPGIRPRVVLMGVG